MPNIGPLEIVVILIIALLVLGPKKLPDVGRSVGKGLREFRSAMSGMSLGGDEDEDDELMEPAEEEPAKKKQPDEKKPAATA